jgi:hypothetical protein
MLVGILAPPTGAIHRFQVPVSQQLQQLVVAEVEAGTTTTQEQVDQEADNPTHPVHLRAVELRAKDFLVAITRVVTQPVEEVELPQLAEVEMQQQIEQVTGGLGIRPLA